ncbi:MAG TPA: flagellar basal body P-ring protein FlgI [Candidatus Hydrogenedentes bacterium]|nr:flagellar basal body P-ring protein FlgI [Candidatus Hydrogenedentota bacterium]HOV60514.1 flagellar basal body P-ring protein FlgI [Candidatus Hydrogenedentota bacterium]
MRLTDRFSRKGIPAGLALVTLLVLPALAGALTIGDVCEVQGARGNMLKGMGIVVGLAGTGDKAPAALAAQQRLLERMGMEGLAGKALKTANMAVVMVTAVLPPFAKEGTRIDVKVDSLYDCKSLQGGMLLETHLTGPGLSETVYAVAQGPVIVGGYSATGGGGGAAKSGHVTSGRIPQGAYVEREVPASITDGERIVLLIKQPDFQLARSIIESIERKYGPESAVALGAGTVRVTIPDAWRTDLVGFIADVCALPVQPKSVARVVINERTGTVVVGGDVMILPCQVAHGNLTIKITSTPQVTPAVPFSDAPPVVTQLEDIMVQETEARLMPVQGTSAAEVAEALNKLRVTPRDIISIFQAMREAGALQADLEVM